MSHSACILAYMQALKDCCILCSALFSLGVACVCITHVAMMVCMVCECCTNRQRVSAAAGAAGIAVYKRTFLVVHH